MNFIESILVFFTTIRDAIVNAIIAIISAISGAIIGIINAIGGLFGA